LNQSKAWKKWEKRISEATLESMKGCLTSQKKYEDAETMFSWPEYHDWVIDEVIRILDENISFSDWQLNNNTGQMAETLLEAMEEQLTSSTSSSSSSSY
jgi:hypothetical protein